MVQHKSGTNPQIQKFPDAKVVNQEYIEIDFRFEVECDSVNLMVSNLACSAQTEFFSECRKVLRPAGLLIFAVLATDSGTEAKVPELDSDGVKFPQQESIELPDLGDLLQELELTLTSTPTPALDLRRFHIISNTLHGIHKFRKFPPNMRLQTTRFLQKSNEVPCCE